MPDSPLADTPLPDSPLALNYRTAATELFGIRLPVVAGGLQWLADADYVSAAGRAGIIGFITAASFPDIPTLRDEIRKCRDLCDGAPFGVNVSMLPKLVQGERTNEIFALIVDEGVKFVETSGRNPEAYLPPLKEAGIVVLHKVPAVRYAAKAQSIGVDAVSIVGAECGGHPGLDVIGSFVQAAMADEQITIPYLIGGGVGTGSQVIAALAMGAAGVVVGTRFTVAEEIWAHEGYKQRLIDADERDTQMIMQSVRNTVRALRNETTEIVARYEAEHDDVTIQDLLPFVSGRIGRKAYETGDCSHGVLSVGQSVVFADAIEPLADIVRRFEQEMMKASRRLNAISAVSG